MILFRYAELCKWGLLLLAGKLFIFQSKVQVAELWDVFLHYLRFPYFPPPNSYIMGWLFVLDTWIF